MGMVGIQTDLIQADLAELLCNKKHSKTLQPTFLCSVSDNRADQILESSINYSLPTYTVFS